MNSVSYNCIACEKPITFGDNYCPVCGQKQRSGTAPLWLGERRLVTIMFADLASFTATSEKTDPEDVIDMLNHVFTRLMIHCDREGGYLDKIVGDQLMILFGAPRTQEDDPVRAVRAALAMQAEMEALAPAMRERVGTACKLNIGINTGIVMWGRVGPMGRAAPTVIGDSVNLACRLEQFATHGQIIVSDPVYFLTRRFFEYEILDPIKVKGKSRPVPVHMPLRARQSLRTHQQDLSEKTPLFERDIELQSLRAHWTKTLSGEPQAVFVIGAAGVGKSRLLSEFSQELQSYNAQKKPLVLHSYSTSAHGGNYSPLVDFLEQIFAFDENDSAIVKRRKIEDRAEILSITNRRFLPLIGYLLGWYENEIRLTNQDNELELLRASAFDIAAALFFKQSMHRPIMLLIDDFQWVDVNSLQWLSRLVLIKQTMQRDYVGHNLMVVIASRHQTEIPIESFQAEGQITLNVLSESARSDLISYLLPGGAIPSSLVHQLIQESGGNPFYLEEATDGLVQSGQLIRQNGNWELTRTIDEIVVPPSVEGLVMANLDSLDPTSRIVLQHAAVIGSQFGYGLLSAITSVENIDRAIAELVGRNFIKEIESDEVSRTFMFTQMMVREVAYRGLMRKTRRELHEQIARLTEADAISEEIDFEALAHHYAAGGDTEKTIAYNWLAGRHALDKFKFDEAHDHLERVWQTLKEQPEADPEIRRNIANALGDASVFTGDFALAVENYQLLHTLAGDSSGEQAMLNYKQARLYLHQAEVEDSYDYYKQALNLAGDNPSLMAQIEAEMRLLYDLT